MKFKDIIDIKSQFAALPHNVLAWALTITSLIIIGTSYIGARHWYNNYLHKQHQSAVSDSLLIASNRMIITQVSRLSRKVDSLNYCLTSEMVITNEKINIVARHVEGIENKNNSITTEYRKLDSLYQLLYYPFINQYQQQKKTSVPTALN